MDVEQLPPENRDAEMATIGSMMMSAQCVDDVVSVLGHDGGEAFYLPAHQKLYEVIIDLRFRQRKPIDLLLVEDALEHTGDVALVGGQEYMIDLADSFADTANARYYAQLVLEKYRLRSIIGKMAELSQLAHSELAESQAIAGELAKLTHSIAAEQAAEEKSLVEIIASLPETMFATNTRMLRSLIGPLDDKIGGFYPGSLTVIGARTSVGKTSLAMQIALAAAEQEALSIFVSLEMTVEDLALRIVASKSGIPSNVLRTRKSPEDVRHATQVAIEAVMGMNFRLIAPQQRMVQIEAAIKKAARDEPIGMIVIDYIQLCRSEEKFTSRHHELSAISKQFKELARETNAAVLLLSQLRRPTGGAKALPSMMELRESGSLEEDADIVILLHPEETEPHATMPTMLLIEKNRMGATGYVTLDFHKPTTTFRSRDIAPLAADQVPF